MFLNYLKIALRNLRKRKGYAGINIIGLAIGIAAGLLILKYVSYELSYDDFHAQGEYIYRVRYDFVRDGELVFKSATAFPKVGPAMQEDIPEVEGFARLFLLYGGEVVRYKDLSFKEENLFLADPSFLTLFSYQVIMGDRATALTEPNTVVISAEAARKYFGDEDPLGKTIRLGNYGDFEINGVAVSPENSHIKFNFLFSYASGVQFFGEGFENAWGWYDFYNYIKLNPEADRAALEGKMEEFVVRHGGEDNRGRTLFTLQPLQDIHLYSDLIQEARVNGDGTSVYFLMIIAFFILLIAWVNYINLSTARAIERAKEIGIRKVVGAERGQLMRQLILESFLLNVLAAGTAIVLMKLALPFFNSLTGKDLILNLGSDPFFWISLACLFAAGAFLSGLYPAFVLSSYRPVLVLKGTFGHARKGFRLRKGLVAGQFAASVALIAGTLLVYQQITFMRNQDLGIDINQTLVVNGPGGLANDSLFVDQMNSLKQELLKHPQIQSVAASTEIPGNLIYWTNGSRKPDDDSERSTIMYKVGIDYDYLAGYGHHLLAGRGYTPEFTADENSVILNEKALDVLGFSDPEQAVNQLVIIGGDTLQIVGVVENFHQEGLRKAYDQIAFLLLPNAQTYFSLKIGTGVLNETISYVGQQFAAFFPENPYTYFFPDSFFENQYRSDRQFGKAFGFFAILAIIVACLGLFGLSSFTASRRTKEIGIRKVLGSSVGNILVLLSVDFLKLVLLAGVLVIPIVWYLMERWLEGFAFRINISIWAFVLATVLTLIIALMTVSFQSIKAAVANPAKSLRYE